MSLIKFRFLSGLNAAACNATSRISLGSANSIFQRKSLDGMGRRSIYKNISTVPSSSSLLLASTCMREQPHKSLVQLSQWSPSLLSTNFSEPFTSYARRSFSFYNDPPSQQNMGNPAYTVYGETFAFTMKAIPPEFRTLPSGTTILDASKRGRFLLEWTPMGSGHDDNGYGSGNRRYQWDASTRFALTAEEAGSLLAKLDRGDSSVEFSRRVSGDQMGQQTLDKVFLAKPIKVEETKNDGISLLVDYVDPDNHQLGQVPHPQRNSGGGGPFGDEGLKGPFEIQLMVGEYKVFRSIIEYSIPKLVGWSTMFDRNVEQAVSKSVQNAGSQRGGHGGGSPHNYQGGGGGY